MSDLVLTMSEIEARYDGEWVLLDAPRVDEQDCVVAGRLVCHSPDVDEVHRAAMALRSRDTAFLYIGAPRIEGEIVLIPTFVADDAL
jgi:hypothetical protein